MHTRSYRDGFNVRGGTHTAVVAPRGPNTARIERGDKSIKPLVGARDAIVKPKCACGGGCPKCEEATAGPQKLTLGRADDVCEREADRVAEQVLRMPTINSTCYNPPIGKPNDPPRPAHFYTSSPFEERQRTEEASGMVSRQPTLVGRSRYLEDWPIALKRCAAAGNH
jgi:hypothetical protein